MAIDWKERRRRANAAREETARRLRSLLSTDRKDRTRREREAKAEVKHHHPMRPIDRMRRLVEGGCTCGHDIKLHALKMERRGCGTRTGEPQVYGECSVESCHCTVVAELDGEIDFAVYEAEAKAVRCGYCDKVLTGTERSIRPKAGPRCTSCLAHARKTGLASTHYELSYVEDRSDASEMIAAVETTEVVVGWRLWDHVWIPKRGKRIFLGRPPKYAECAIAGEIRELSMVASSRRKGTGTRMLIVGTKKSD